MLIRIDTDLFVNVNQIFSYKLYDEGESYKLTIWSNSGQVVHNVFYVKSNPVRMSLLMEIVNAFKELTINPDRSMEVGQFTPVEPEEDIEVLEDPIEEKPKKKHIVESVAKEEARQSMCDILGIEDNILGD